VRQFEIVGLVETWVEERSWEKIEKWLPIEYKWECQGPNEERRKEEPRSGILEIFGIDILGLVMFIF
jgi:hypothetical protein